MDHAKGELTLEQFEWVWEKIVEQRGVDPNEYSKYLVDRKAWNYWRKDLESPDTYPEILIQSQG